MVSAMSGRRFSIAAITAASRVPALGDGDQRVEGASGGRHGGVHVGAVPLGTVPDQLLGGRIDHLDDAAAGGCHPLHRR